MLHLVYDDVYLQGRMDANSRAALWHSTGVNASPVGGVFGLATSSGP